MRVKILLISVLLVILMSAGVHSFGIAFQYMDNNTIELYPGQNYMFELEIQNTEDKSEKVEVSLDSSIATLVGGPILNVPGKTYDTHVYFNITIPENAQYGDVYNINYLVAPASSDGEGQIPIAVKYDRAFKIRVVEQEKAVEEQEPVEIPSKGFSIPTWIYIPGLIIVIIVVLVLVWRKSHQISEGIIKTKPKQSIFKPKHKPSLGPAILPKPKKDDIKRPTISPDSPDSSLKSFEQKETVNDSVQGLDEGKKPVQQEPYYQKTAQKTIKQENNVMPNVTTKTGHTFHLYDGRILRDLDDLYHTMHNMTLKTFNHHVTSTKNDFANWVSSALGKKELSHKLSEKTSRHDMLKLIENELENK